MINFLFMFLIKHRRNNIYAPFPQVEKTLISISIMWRSSSFNRRFPNSHEGHEILSLGSMLRNLWPISWEARSWLLPNSVRCHKNKWSARVYKRDVLSILWLKLMMHVDARHISHSKSWYKTYKRTVIRLIIHGWSLVNLKRGDTIIGQGIFRSMTWMYGWRGMGITGFLHGPHHEERSFWWWLLTCACCLMHLKSSHGHHSNRWLSKHPSCTSSIGVHPVHAQ